MKFHELHIIYYILYVCIVFTMTDTDECATAPCSTNALCVNTIGSFQCVCNYGFKGDGVICKGIMSYVPS